MKFTPATATMPLGLTTPPSEATSPSVCCPFCQGKLHVGGCVKMQRRRCHAAIKSAWIMQANMERGNS
eukprot:SAG11_NODE_954_length_6397_cov_11.146237_3_plen_68_part_00